MSQERAATTPWSTSTFQSELNDAVGIWKFFLIQVSRQSPRSFVRHSYRKRHRLDRRPIIARSYWIPGSYALALSEKGDSFLRLLKHKGFREENMTKVGLYAIGTSTTLESNKSHKEMVYGPTSNPGGIP